MEEPFTDTEKKAVAHVLFNLADADFQKYPAEKSCLDACMEELGFDASHFVPVQRNELPAQAYETVRCMSLEKKRVFSRMMTRLSRSDNHFGLSERALVREILEVCRVPFVHK